MTKPLDRNTNMFKIIEGQLATALAKDYGEGAGIDFIARSGQLGEHTRMVLAEILGAVNESGLCRISKMPTPEELHAQALPAMPKLESVGRRVGIPSNEVVCTFVESVDPYLVLRAIEDAPRLREIIHRPESDDFLKGVSIEAEFQRQKHGVDNLMQPTRDWHQWFWVSGYLLGKALSACLRGDREKAKHHLVTTAALLANWHNVFTGKPNATVTNVDAGMKADVLGDGTHG